MKLTPLQKRAERKSRNKTGLDMNLVALIDIFTILIFFLMSSAAGVEILSPGKAVTLPQSSADKMPARDPGHHGQRPRHPGRRAPRGAGHGCPGDPQRRDRRLKAELDLQSKRVVIRAENQAQGKAITIMGDKDIPYRLLRKVMVTASRADFSDVSFAVTPKAVKT